MSVTYTPGASARDNVRLLIADADVTAAVFEDEELDALLVIESSNVLRTAAMALETIASSQALTLKVMSLMDLRTDGAAVSRELRARARDMRARAEELESAEDDGGFDVAELTVNHFAWREQVHNQALREL
jgi:hypothetical protein